MPCPLPPRQARERGGDECPSAPAPATPPEDEVEMSDELLGGVRPARPPSSASPMRRRGRVSGRAARLINSYRRFLIRRLEFSRRRNPIPCLLLRFGFVV
ncbi:hypothetical protein BS78_09G145200 [Paspalum vaginatum]|nr:hypothetical protein BS78_09G145200 [Paspalum vaginatum]